MDPTVVAGMAQAGAEFQGKMLDIALQLYAMNRQEKENLKAQEYNKGIFDLQLGWEKDRFGREEAIQKEQIGLGKEKFKWEKGFTEKRAEEEREDKMFNRKWQVMNGLTNFMNSSPKIRNNMLNMWRR